MPAAFYFYPRSPCGERPAMSSSSTHPYTISIHALLAESDLTPPICKVVGASISIHALLAESDASSITLRSALPYFYPRSPCGERLRTCQYFFRDFLNFYPRSPCGERLVERQVHIDAVHISIHALLAESDAFRRAFAPPFTHFYPRSPCGERLPLLL